MTAAIAKIDHVVITSAQPETSAAFYQTLGFTVKKSADRYELFAGNFKINLHSLGKELEPHARHVQTGSADFCFEINGSLEELIAQIKRLGTLTETEIVVRRGVRGEMRSIYLRDPDGNLIELSSYSDANLIK